MVPRFLRTAEKKRFIFTKDYQQRGPHTRGHGDISHESCARREDARICDISYEYCVRREDARMCDMDPDPARANSGGRLAFKEAVVCVLAKRSEKRIASRICRICTPSVTNIRSRAHARPTTRRTARTISARNRQSPAVPAAVEGSFFCVCLLSCRAYFTARSLASAAGKPAPTPTHHVAEHLDGVFSGVLPLTIPQAPQARDALPLVAGVEEEEGEGHGFFARAEVRWWGQIWRFCVFTTSFDGQPALVPVLISHFQC